MPESLSDRPHRLWAGDAAYLTAAIFCYGMAASMTLPFLALFFVNQLHVPQPVFAAFLVVNTVGGVVVNQALGRSADRHGRYRLAALLTAAPSVVGYAVFAAVRLPAVLLVVGSVFLTLNSAVFSQLFALLRRTVEATPPRGRIHPLTVARSLFSLGFVLGPALASAAVARAGYPALFLGAAGIFVLVVLSLLPVRATAAAQRPTPYVTPPSFRPVLSACAAFMTVTAATALGTIVLPLLATRVIGASVPQTGLAFSVAALLEIPLMLAFGALDGWVRRTTLLSVGMALFAGYDLLLSRAHSIHAVYLAQAAGAVPTALLLGSGLLFFQSLMPNHPGFSTALYSNTTKLGTVVGQLLFGTLSELVTDRQLFVLAAVVSALGAGWFAWVTRRPTVWAG